MSPDTLKTTSRNTMENIDWTRYQDVPGQLPTLQSYTQFCLFFPAQNTQEITQLVRDTSIRLASIFPWLSGRVINRGGGPDHSGTFEIIPYRQPGTGVDMIVKEESTLKYEEIVAAKAPMSTLDGEIFSPKWDLTRMYDLAKDIAPVLVLQLTFLDGGMVLTFAAAHNAIDMSGLGTLIELFGKIARGEGRSEDEIDWGYRDRRKLFSLLDPEEVGIDHDMMVVDLKTTKVPLAHDPPSSRWAYIRFTKDKLTRLKELASLNVLGENESDKHRSTEWISTDDALTAFLWQRITLVRLSHHAPNDQREYTLCRALNARRLLNPPISQSYLGHFVSCTYASIPAATISEAPLPRIAQSLRTSLSAQNDLSTRSFFTFINKHKDKRQINFTARMDLSRDMLVSSGAGLKMYNVDFGALLGKPEYVRRPRWDAAEGVVYFMPKTRDGDVDVAVCLAARDWGRLNDDEVWREFGEYIG